MRPVCVLNMPIPDPEGHGYRLHPVVMCSDGTGWAWQHIVDDDGARWMWVEVVDPIPGTPAHPDTPPGHRARRQMEQEYLPPWGDA